ncbi:MAG: hypothetical protein ABSH44_12115 [Bryobacteraceae bacterium]|jgi:hypothetical protein
MGRKNAVKTTLEEVIRLKKKKIQTIPRFFGTGIWRGDLAAMREDRPRRNALRVRQSK